MKNKQLFNKIDFFEKLACYGDRKVFLQKLAQELKSIDPNVSLKPVEQLSSSYEASKVTTLPQVTITATPPIDKNLQKMLNDALVPSGKIFPLDIDGKLGDKTKKAILVFESLGYGKATVQNLSNYLSKSSQSQSATISPMSSGLSSLPSNTKAEPGYDVAGKERSVLGPT